ncbi:acyl-CoA synthetase [Microbacterium xylanilyticum]
MSAPRTLTLRHVQLARAALAAVAALMITFSADHSAIVGLSVFSGFALVTALIHIVAAWLVAPTGWRWPFILLAAFSILTGMAGGVPAWRSTPLFFVVVIAWGALTGLVELLAGLRARRLTRTGSAPAVAADGARDAILVGALGLALAVGLLCVPTTYALRYTITGAGSFTLTGITLGVGIFGAYAAIVAVFLGIAGLSPRPRASADEGADTAAAGTAPAENEGSA